MAVRMAAAIAVTMVRSSPAAMSAFVSFTSLIVAFPLSASSATECLRHTPIPVSSMPAVTHQ
jgi:hypothetical protein